MQTFTLLQGAPDRQGNPRWKLQWRWPAGAPAEITGATKQPSITFTDERVGRHWADAFTTFGPVEGYRLYKAFLSQALPEPEPDAAPPVPAPRPEPRPAHPAQPAQVVPASFGPRMKVAEAVERMLAYKRLRHEGSDDYREGLRSMAGYYVLPYFGDLWLDELAAADRIAQWQYDLIHGVIPRVGGEQDDDELEPLSVSRIKNIYIVLQQTVKWAMANGAETGLRVNPCIPLTFPDDADRTRQPVFLTPDQVGLIVQHIRHEYRDLIICAVGTGMRWGELAALHVEDCTLHNGIIRINVRRALKHRGRRIASTKTKRGLRWVQIDASTPVGERLLANLRGKSPTALVFTGPRGGRISNGHFHSRAWIPMMRALDAGFDEWMIRPRFHDLRHTAASLMLNEGHNLFKVAKILGHSYTTCEKIYGHLKDEEAVAATTSIGRMFAELFAHRRGPDGSPVAVIAAEEYDEDAPLADVIDLNAHRQPA